MNIKKIISAFLLFFITCTSIPLRGSLEIQDQKSSGVSPKSSSSYNYSHIALAFLAFELLFFYAYFTDNDTVKNKLIEQVYPKQLLQNFIVQYGTHFLATFFHEFGHALAAKLLTNDPINIHLGGSNSSTTEKKSPLLKMCGISIDGLSSTKGYSLCNGLLDKDEALKIKLIQMLPEYLKKNNKDLKTIGQEDLISILKELQEEPVFKALDQANNLKKTTRAAILLAGGFSAILGHHLMKLLFAAISEHKNNPAQSFGALLATASKQALQVDSVTLHQLVNMFIPFATTNGHSDAYKLYTSCLNISPELVQQISRLALPIHLGAECTLTYYQSTPKTPLLCVFLLAFLNFQLRGYLKFSL